MSDPATAPAVDDIEVESSDPPVDIATAPVVPPVVPAPNEDDDAGFDDEPSVAAKPDTPTDPPKPDRRSLQAKIDKEVGLRRQAERERDELRSRFTQPAEPKPAEKAEPQATRPKPTEAEIGTKYADYPAYIEDLTDWKLEQRDAQHAIQTRQRQTAERHETHAAKFSERIAKAEEADPQFWSKIDAKIANLMPSTALDPAAIDGALRAARAGDPSARLFVAQLEIADAIFDSDYSTDLMAHFSANLNDFQRLSTLPPKLIAREIGRLEAQFVRPEAASPGPAPKTPVISAAPPPIKPVGTTASTADRDPLTEDLDIDEHIRVMNARDKKGRFKGR